MKIAILHIGVLADVVAHKHEQSFMVQYGDGIKNRWRQGMKMGGGEDKEPFRPARPILNTIHAQMVPFLQGGDMSSFKDSTKKKIRKFFKKI